MTLEIEKCSGSVNCGNEYVPTRNLLRHGNFKDFHLYHAWRMGPMGFDDIMSSWTWSSKAAT